ncbi:hypothetical protein [Microbacterium sp. TNHR37B]|uniref:hypothetical protein n=1 Tax=Microbacterium sp. TNHR37B TaxID=1775956 RepID=UPI0012FC422F|nr:hypothetical protein [Microbacterium sp. TNHR37B]
MARTVSATSVFERDTPLFVESESGRLAKYPASPWARWGLRLLIAAVFAAIATLYHLGSGGDWSATANGALAERVPVLTRGAFDEGVGIVGALYPPLTSLLALLIPGGAYGLAIAGSAAASLMLQLIVQSLQRKGFPFGMRIVFTLALATTPIFAYIATTNFESVVGLLFFGLGMVDLVRFVTWANTQAGFRAGLLFACAACSDSTVTFSALVAAVAGTLIIQSRRGARLANAFVVAFPTLALFASLALLGIAFGAGPLAMVRGDLVWHPERVEGFLGSVTSPGGLLFLAPVVVMILTSFALRFPGTALIAVFLAVSTLIAYFLGLTPPGNAGTTYTLMLLLAVAIVPAATTIAHRLLTASVAVVLWLIGWVTSSQWATLRDWLGVVVGETA